MLDYTRTRAWSSGEVRQRYTARDTILYALGVGFGADPLDERQRRFVYERELRAVPTMAAVLASPGFWMRDRAELGIDHLRLVHAEQSLSLHARLPAEGEVVGTSRVTRVVDKGEGKGALLTVEKPLVDAATGRLLASAEQVFLCCADGGFSGGNGGDAAAPPPAALPQGAPDLTVETTTRPDAAALYRLSGDLNPLHIDPDVAGRAGFARPILHGLATYGIAAHLLLRHCCDYDPQRLATLRVRFSAPVHPGDALRLEGWRRGSQLLFRCSVPARGATVISHGLAEFAR